MLSLFKKKNKFFTAEEKHHIVEAIQNAEHRTSGEVRVFVESRCSFMDALDRAVQVFEKLEMYKTEQRNGVLVYIAIKDRQLAVYGDQGIHEKVGEEYWNKVVADMLGSFNRDNYTEGISDCIRAIGEALQSYFPYNSETDINELPDDIVFGR